MRIELYGRNAGMNDVQITLKTGHLLNVYFTGKLTTKLKSINLESWVVQYFSFPHEITSSSLYNVEGRWPLGLCTGLWIERSGFDSCPGHCVVFLGRSG